MSEPQARKKLDFLYQEVLGEVAGLINRLETANDALTQTSAKLTESIDAVGKANERLKNMPADSANAVQAAIEESSRKINTDLLDAVQAPLLETRLELDQLSRSTARYAAIALHSAQKMALLALAVGAASGAVAAMLVLSVAT